MAAKTTRTFVDLLLSNTTHPIWISSLPNDKEAGERHVLTSDVKRILEFCDKWDVPGRGVFYCVSSINGARRTIETAAETRLLFADIDYKDIDATPAEILKTIKALDCKPCRLHLSGNGVHALWLLADAAPANAEITALLKKLCRVVGGDPHVCHPAALMRMPGTHNSKFNAWTPVRVSVLIEEPCYDLETLKEWLSGDPAPILPAKEKAAQNPFIAFAKDSGIKTPIDVEGRLRAMEYRGGGERGIHATQLACSASLLEQGDDLEDMAERIVEATQAASGVGPDWNWEQEYEGVIKMGKSWLKKHPRNLNSNNNNNDNKEVMRNQSANGPTVGGAEHKTEPQATRSPGANVVDLGQARALLHEKTKPDKKHYHLVLAQGLIEALKERNERLMFIEGEDTAWYRNGIWERLTAAAESDRLGKELGEGCRALNIVSTTKLISEARGELRRSLQASNKIVWDAHNKIAIKDCLLDPITLKLQPLCPEHYATHTLDIQYDPKAKCPQWEQMLNDCFEDSDTISVIQETLGAALLINKPKAMKRGLLLVGDSDSGKSNILQVLAGLISDNPITTSLETLENSHGTASFQRHAPWLLVEAFEQNRWRLSSVVKTILAGEGVNINPKGRDMATHVYKGAAFWGSNWPAKFKDASNAMSNRLIVVPCRQQFNAENLIGVALEAHKHGYEEPSQFILETEKSGVLNWALRGLIRLRRRGFYELTDEMQSELQDLRQKSNYIAGFIGDEHAELDENCMMLQQDLCAAVSMWQSAKYGENKNLIANEIVMDHVRASYGKYIIPYESNGMKYYIGVRLTESGKSLWTSLTEMAGTHPPGKHWSTSHNAEDINKMAPISLQRARVLRSERLAKQSVRMKKL